MMKKILLAILFGSAAFVHAQSLEIITSKSDTRAEGNAFTTQDIPSYAVVKNITNEPVDVLVKRIDKNYNALTDSNAICWGLCFQPDVSESPASFKRTLQPGEESAPGDFSGHVYPDLDGQPFVGDITYVFFVMQNRSDTVAHTITYEVSADFSVNELADPIELSVYPNPASSRITISYDLHGKQPATLELVNIVGKKVFATKLDNSVGKKELNVSSFAPGVYFYSVKNRGETILTRKLIIK